VWWDGPSQQPSTHRAIFPLFPPFPSHSGNGKNIRRSRMRKPMDKNKDKETTHQLLQLAKCLVTNLGIGKQR